MDSYSNDLDGKYWGVIYIQELCGVGSDKYANWIDSTTDRLVRITCVH